MKYITSSVIFTTEIVKFLLTTLYYYNRGTLSDSFKHHRNHCNRMDVFQIDL